MSTICEREQDSALSFVQRSVQALQGNHCDSAAEVNFRRQDLEWLTSFKRYATLFNTNLPSFWSANLWITTAGGISWRGDRMDDHVQLYLTDQPGSAGTIA